MKAGISGVILNTNAKYQPAGSIVKIVKGFLQAKKALEAAHEKGTRRDGGVEEKF
jgi:hypothetical protein